MKKNFLRIILCVLAISAFVCAFAVMANAESTPIYIGKIGNDATISEVKYSRWASQVRLYLTKDAAGTETEGKFNKNSDFSMSNTSTGALTNCVFIPLDGDVSAQSANLVESGLYYEIEGTKMTITGKIKKQSDDKDVPWFVPAVNGKLDVITEIEVAEDTGLTRIPDHCFNNCSNVTKVTIPTTAKIFDNESLSRMGKLATLKNWEGEYETGIDLRGFAQAWHLNSQALMSTCAYGATFYVDSISANVALTKLGSASKANIMKVYAPTVEANAFAKSLVSLANNKYTVEVYPISTGCSVEQLGFQVRTESYNGLRSRFKHIESDSISALKIAVDGVLLDTPEEIPLSGGENASEFGVIVGTIDNINTYGADLVKNGNEYVTKNAKIVKMAADPDKIDANGYFYVTVTNFEGKAQMGTKIYMRPYEITSSGVSYGTALDAASIYDATIGLYSHGLLNSGADGNDILWGVLDEFKMTSFDDSFISALSAKAKAKDKSGTDTKFKSVGGELVDAKGATVSIFESNDKHIAIIHGAAQFDGSISLASNWDRFNHFNTEFMGFTIDSIVIDADVKTLGGDALKGIKDTKVVIYPEGIKLGNQTLNKANSVETFIPCGKYTADDWASGYVVNLADLSRADVSNVGMSNVFDGAKGIGKIIFPDVVNKTLTPFSSQGFLSSTGSSTANKYVLAITHESAPLTNNVADLRGTGMYVSFVLSDGTASEGLYHDSVNAWGGALASVGTKTIYQDEPDGKTYKYTYSKYDTSMSAGNKNAYTRELVEDPE